MARKPNAALAHQDAVAAVLQGNHVPQAGWTEYIVQHYRLTGQISPGCDMADFYAAYVPRWLAQHGWQQAGSGWLDPEDAEGQPVSEKDAHRLLATRLDQAERERKAAAKRLLAPRQHKGRTLDALAAATSIAAATLADYQQGRQVPSPEHLAAIQHALAA